MGARVIMLNDMPWAVCTDDSVDSEVLWELGSAECARLGWEAADVNRYREQLGKQVVYIGVIHVKEVPSGQSDGS